MRPLLGTFAVLLSLSAGLAGCGDEAGDEAGDDDGSVQTDPPPPADPVLVHATAGGGEPATTVTLLPDDDALAAYAEQFDDALATRIHGAADDVDVRDGQVLAAQVVAIGCDVPPAATLDGDAIVPEKVASPMKECLAPVTTVALAAVPD
jgi:hypothetical protein